MSQIDKAKRDARVLTTFLKEHQLAMSHGLALEAMARIAGHRNWATLLIAAAAEDRLAPEAANVGAWPSYVFFFYEDEETLEEKLYFLPLGSNLGDDMEYTEYGVLKTFDKLEVPAGFSLADVIATEVHSLIPSVSKYGLPWYANEELAARFFREELKCPAIDHLQVTFRDTGDDSASQYWFEAKVDPSKVAQLLSAQAQQVVAMRDFADIGERRLSELLVHLKAGLKISDADTMNGETYLREYSSHITLQGELASYSVAGLFAYLNRAIDEAQRLIRNEFEPS